MKIILSLICTLMLNTAFAKTVARVIDVSGNAFLFTEKNKTQSLKYGSRIIDLGEVMVEDGGTLSVVNAEGHIIHINGGSLVKFFDGVAELKNGYVWVNAKSEGSTGKMNTTNSVVNYSQGQFIYSFDNVSGKTQLMVLTGDTKLSNSLEPNLKVNVTSGHFSLVDQAYNNGLPRSPTKVGLDSYKSLKGVFANFKALQNSKIDEMMGMPKRAARKIASVDDQFSSSSTYTSKVASKKGKLITIKTFGSNNRIPASASPMDYYKDIKSTEAQKRKKQKTGKTAKITYIGFPVKVNKPKTTQVKIKTKVKKSNVQRLPASVQKSKLINELQGPSEFEKSLMQKTIENKRHSDEVNNLIDDLKTYQQDYKKNY